MVFLNKVQAKTPFAPYFFLIFLEKHSMNRSLSSYLAVFLILLTLIATGFILYVDEQKMIYIVPFLVALVGLYFFQPAIDWWWYQKYPPDVEAPIKRIYETQLPYYQRLNTEARQKFRSRAALYMEANDFRPQVIESVPEDVKAVIAANVVQLTFGQDDERFRMPDFERIVLYPGVFPTPQHLEKFHASEVFIEDGVLLFAMDHLMPGTLKAQQYFNIGLYEYAKVFRLSFPKHTYPTLPESIWADYEAISRFPKEKVEGFVGLENLDLWAVGVSLFFSFPGKFQERLPELHQALVNVFNQNPAKESNPVVVH